MLLTERGEKEKRGVFFRKKVRTGVKCFRGGLFLKALGEREKAPLRLKKSPSSTGT